MSTMIRSAASRYFNSGWIPSATAIVTLLCYTLAMMSKRSLFVVLDGVLLMGLGFCVLGILVAAIWNLTERRWAKGLINLLMLPLVGMGVVCAFGFVLVVSVFGPSEDGFADNLRIPENIKPSEPQSELRPSPGGPEDTFQATLLAALKTPGSGDSSITATVNSLVTLRKTAPDVLRRYLVSSPSWRVFEERDATYAARFEVWFVPDSGRPERKLMERVFRIEGWQR